MLFNIQYTMSKCLLKCLTSVHVYFLSLPESQNHEMFLARISEIILRNYTVLARLIAECLEIKLVSAVNQICRFAATMKKKFVRKLTVACHRHPSKVAYVRANICFKNISR